MEKKSYILLFRPLRSDFIQTMTDHEKQVMGAHAAYLQGLARDGVLVMAGHCEKDPFGISIVSVNSEDEANAIMAKDPVVTEKIMDVEVKAWRTTFAAK